MTRRATNHADLFDVHLHNERPDGWAPSTPPELQGETHIRLDAETNSLEWWKPETHPVGWAYYLPASGRRGYLPFAHKGGGNLDEAAVKRWAQRELRGVQIDNANTRYDMHISRGWGVDLVEQDNTFGDVAHRAALLDDHRFKLGLDQLAHDFLGPDRGKINLNLTDKGRLWELPAWEVERYAVEDVVLVNDLIEVMQPELEAQDLLRVLDLEQQIIPVVVEMEKNGVYLDMELLAKWTQEAREEYEALLHKIFRASGVRLSSTDASKETAQLFKSLGIPFSAFTGKIDKRTGDPTPSFTDEVLSHIDHPVIRDFRQAAHLADLLSKYLDKYSNTIRSDGWLRFNLHQLRIGRSEDDKKGTNAGRFSSAGDEYGGFNVQQVVSPKKQIDHDWCVKYPIRNLFKPRDGVWCAVDAAQIEYRIFAHFSNSADIIGRYHAAPPYEVDEDGDFLTGPQASYHKIMQKILKVGKPDIKYKHTKITNFCKLFGAQYIKFAVTLELITEQQGDDLNEKYAPARWKGKPFGERVEAIRNEPILKVAVDVYDTYDRMVPDAKATLDLAKQVANERGYVKTLYGRRSRFPRRGKSRERTHKALNNIVQGTAADINKQVMVEVYKRRRDLGITMRMTVHDEVDFDLHDPKMLPMVDATFNHQYVPLKVPILWDSGTGPSWGEAKGKA